MRGRGIVWLPPPASFSVSNVPRVCASTKKKKKERVDKRQLQFALFPSIRSIRRRRRRRKKITAVCHVDFI
jgi:hypothetical protein